MQHKRKKYHKPQTKHIMPLTTCRPLVSVVDTSIKLPTLPAQPVNGIDNVLTQQMHWNQNLTWKFSFERDSGDSRRCTTAMYQSSDCCKGDGNGMVLSESGVEGGWLPDQRGVLGLDDDTVVT